MRREDMIIMIDMLKGLNRMLYDKQTSHKDRELLRGIKKYVTKEPELYIDWEEDSKRAFIKVWSDGSMSFGLHDRKTDIKKYMPLSDILKGLAKSMFKLIDWHK